MFVDSALNWSPHIDHICKQTYPKLRLLNGLSGFLYSDVLIKIYKASIYTSELILCFTICVPSATRHNIHMYPYYPSYSGLCLYCMDGLFKKIVQQVGETSKSNFKNYFLQEWGNMFSTFKGSSEDLDCIQL